MLSATKLSETEKTATTVSVTKAVIDVISYLDWVVENNIASLVAVSDQSRHSLVVEHRGLGVVWVAHMHLNRRA